MSDRNAPKPAPARAAADEWFGQMLAALPREQRAHIANMRVTMIGAFECGFHAALRHHGLKR